MITCRPSQRGVSRNNDYGNSGEYTERRPPRGGVSRNYTNMPDVVIPGVVAPRAGTRVEIKTPLEGYRIIKVAPHAGA